MTDFETLSEMLTRSGIKYEVVTFHREIPKWEKRETKRPDGTAHGVLVRVPGESVKIVTLETDDGFGTSACFEFDESGTLKSVAGWGE